MEKYFTYKGYEIKLWSHWNFYGTFYSADINGRVRKGKYASFNTEEEAADHIKEKIDRMERLNKPSHKK